MWYTLCAYTGMEGGSVSTKTGLSTFNDITYKKGDASVTITINRPDKYNCYTVDTLCEIQSAVNQATNDDSVAAIIITGEGTVAFCTGGDVEEYATTYTKQPHEYWKYMQVFRKTLEAILRSSKPVIARLNGMAVGGGNEFQLACDLTFAGNHTFLAQVGTKVGSVACGGATQWLPVAVGAKRAADMLFLNPRIPAKQAEEWGLINKAVPTVKHNGAFLDDPQPDQVNKANKGEDGYSVDLSGLDNYIDGVVKQLVDKFPECIRYTKQQVNFWKELSWNMTVGHAADWLSLHFTCTEPYEGMTAFTEKRPAGYRDLRKKLAEGSSPEFLWGPYQHQCPKCGIKGIPADFSFCGKCGSQLGQK